MASDLGLEEELQVSINHQVGLITFNRPALHNAISKRMWENIPALMLQLKRDGAAVIVFTGAGDSFASGADLAELQAIDSESSARALWESIRGCLEFIWSFPLVTFAMINGACIGGGCLLACMCDFRFASTDSVFAVPVARLGIILDKQTIERIVAVAGMPLAKEMLFTGAVVSGERAHALGLLHHLLPRQSLEEKVMQTAKQVITNSAQTVQACKSSINTLLTTGGEATADKSVIESYLSEEFRTRIRRSGA